MMNGTYEETAKWKRNLFKVPRGRAGTLFVCEMPCLLDAYSDAPTTEGVALKAAMVLATWLLRKPHPKSKCKDHSSQL